MQLIHTMFYYIIIVYIQSTWIKALDNVKLVDDTYCLEYESKILLDLGYAFRRFITNQALKYAGLEVAKQTALAAFFSAIALPAALLKVSDIIDDPWQLAVDRSKKAGIGIYMFVCVFK